MLVKLKTSALAASKALVAELAAALASATVVTVSAIFAAFSAVSFDVCISAAALSIMIALYMFSAILSIVSSVSTHVFSFVDEFSSSADVTSTFPFSPDSVDGSVVIPAAFFASL